MIRKTIKSAFRIGLWTFLLTLPLTAIPIISGIITGLQFASFVDNRMQKDVDSFLHNMKDASNDWGVSSDFTFRDYQDRNNEFLTLRLNTNDWTAKLGYVLPEQYQGTEKYPDTPIDKHASLDTLMHDTSLSCSPPSREQWVWVTDYGFPRWNPWDMAFEAAILAGYVPSALNGTTLSYVQCSKTASFLCGVWGVDAPALLHFIIEDEPPKADEILEGLTYSAALEDLRPITVRVIELPLKDAYTGLPSHVFPSEKEQVLAIMRGDRLYEQFEPWKFDQLLQNRFEDYAKGLYQRKGTLLYHFGNVDDWFMDNIAEPVRLKEPLELVFVINFMLSTLAANLGFIRPWYFIKEIVLEYLGYPKRGEWVMAEEAYDNPVEGMVAGMMNGMLGMQDALSKVIQNLELNKDAMTTSALFASRESQAPVSQSTATVDEAARRFSEQVDSAKLAYENSPRSRADFEQLVRAKIAASSSLTAHSSAATV